MNKQQTYQSVHHHLNKWQQSLAQVDEVRAKFGAAEKPGSPIGADAVAEIRRAENRALRQWEELQEAVERWSEMVLKSRPPLPEILKTLRANMPTLQAEYGVTSLAVIGNYAKGNDYEAGRLELMFDYKGAFTLLTQVALQEHLEDFLGVKVNLVTKSVIEERERHLMAEAMPV